MTTTDPQNPPDDSGGAHDGGRCAVADGSAVDLSRFSDLEVLRIVGTERPEFVDIIAGEIDKGRTDEQIIRLACDSGGSPQVMRYTQKCLRALRRLAALDALTAESQRLGLYEPNVKAQTRDQL